MKFENLILAIGIGLAGFFIRDGIVEFKKDRTIEVRGLAEKDVSADEASWELRFRSSSQSIAGLNDRVKESSEAIKDFLIHLGFSSNEIRAGTVTVTDNGQYNSNADRESRFSGNGVFTVYSTNVDKINESFSKTDALLAKGVMLESTSVKFNYTKLNDIKPAMLQEATSNARSAAESFSRDSMVKLGKLRSASQGLFSIATPGSDYDDGSSITKRIRVVTKVSFDIH